MADLADLVIFLGLANFLDLAARLALALFLALVARLALDRFLALAARLARPLFNFFPLVALAAFFALAARLALTLLVFFALAAFVALVAFFDCAFFARFRFTVVWDGGVASAALGHTITSAVKMTMHRVSRAAPNND